MSVFIDDQEEKKIPIAEKEDSKKKHLAFKAQEWNEPGAREGIYTETSMYLLSHGNDSSESKLNCIEAVKKELGNVTGEETGWLRRNIDVEDWYRVMKRKLYKHAFVSPFEAMGMLVMANGEKEPRFKIRQERQERRIRHIPHLIS